MGWVGWIPGEDLEGGMLGRKRGRKKGGGELERGGIGRKG